MVGTAACSGGGVVAPPVGMDDDRVSLVAGEGEGSTRIVLPRGEWRLVVVVVLDERLSCRDGFGEEGLFLKPKC